MIEVSDKVLDGYSFIDLFAGIGGFRLALESLGAKCVYSNEWDSAAQDVYEANFGDRPDGDITKVNERSIPDHDILCAGFPCQAFSISGKQKGFFDTRGTLFFDVARIVNEKKPKVVLMENVKNLVSHDDGNTFRTIKHTMNKIGYKFYHAILSASDYGIPQKRERVYMVCFRKDLGINEFKFPEPIHLAKHLKDFLVEDESVVGDMYVEIPGITDVPEISNSPIRLGIVDGGGQGNRIYSTNGVAVTLSSNGGGKFSKTGGYLINGNVRKLHPIECMRLMGFPDDFKMSDSKTQAYKQFGNAVVIDVLQYIGIEIGEALNI